MKAFVFDPLWDELATDEILDKLHDSGIELVVTKDIAPLTECQELFQGQEERLLCLNPDYMSWKLSGNDYKNIPNLKAILIASTASDWVDREVADEQHIPIANIRNYSTQAVAEWAVMMMFNLARQTPRLIKDGFPLDFDKDFMKYRGTQLKGKTAGIIGLGHIGEAIAEACRGVGMNVVYWARSSEDVEFERLELDQLFKTSDVVFPSLARNEETLKLITTEHISSMKKSAMLVSIAHGFVDQDQVLDMVAQGNLFGYGFEGEAGVFDTFKGNVWAAPAYAWTTDESMNNSIGHWTDNMVSATSGEFPTRVN